MTMTHASRLLAWYDRHRRTLPWRAPAGERTAALPGLAVGDHAAADHRGHGRRLFPPLRRALAHASRRWPRRRSTRCSRPGPASATTPAPAICMPAPAPWSSSHGGRFPEDEAGLLALPGIGRYTAGRHPRHRLRPAGLGGRRQCRAGDRPPVRHRDAAARRQDRDRGARRRAGARSSAPATTPRR